MPPWMLAFPLLDREVFGSETKRNTGKEMMPSVLAEWGLSKIVEMSYRPATKMVGVFFSKGGHAFDANTTEKDIIILYQAQMIIFFFYPASK